MNKKVSLTLPLWAWVLIAAVSVGVFCIGASTATKASYDIVYVNGHKVAVFSSGVCIVD
ncbi:MAG: hypothetical protein LBR50_01610 [Tannerella sp.]|jgi:hypothetical protein|nr:hypothetical protein [Tannerella sp.]